MRIRAHGKLGCRRILRACCTKKVEKLRKVPPFVLNDTHQRVHSRNGTALACSKTREIVSNAAGGTPSFLNVYPKRA